MKKILAFAVFICSLSFPSLSYALETVPLNGCIKSVSEQQIYHTVTWFYSEGTGPPNNPAYQSMSLSLWQSMTHEQKINSGPLYMWPSPTGGCNQLYSYPPAVTTTTTTTTTTIPITTVANSRITYCQAQHIGDVNSVPQFNYANWQQNSELLSTYTSTALVYPNIVRYPVPVGGCSSLNTISTTTTTTFPSISTTTILSFPLFEYLYINNTNVFTKFVCDPWPTLKVIHYVLKDNFSELLVPNKYTSCKELSFVYNKNVSNCWQVAPVNANGIGQWSNQVCYQAPLTSTTIPFVQQQTPVIQVPTATLPRVQTPAIPPKPKWKYVYKKVFQTVYSNVRTGAICRSGKISSATGRGACSWNRGVAKWLTLPPKKVYVNKKYKCYLNTKTNKYTRNCKLV